MLLAITGMAAFILSDMQSIKSDFKKVNETQIERKAYVAYAGKLRTGDPLAVATLCRNMVKKEEFCR